MLKITNINVPIDSDKDFIKNKVAKIIGININRIQDFTLSRISIDARKKSNVHKVVAVTLSAENEDEIISKSKNGNLKRFYKNDYTLPPLVRSSKIRPVVVGMGPAGLFAALHLAKLGLAPIVLDRGCNVETRTRDVNRFWNTGILDTHSNVQFGEGGAGTFSDGKLTTGINDPRIKHVFEIFVQHGAPSEIMYVQKPHVGTDILRDVVVNIRKELIELGCDVRFEHKLTGIKTDGDKLVGIKVNSNEAEYELPCDALVLAVGHSARDTFEMLYNIGVPMVQKPFAIGVRIEHNQHKISEVQYGKFADKLPPADYKLSCHLPNGRSAYSFCVCPGGQVIAAASEENRLVTNGMSLRARNGKNINGGFLVGISPDDFDGKHPLAGVEFQRKWEHSAYIAGGETYCAPIQTVEDFLKGQATKKLGNIEPSYLPGVYPTDLHKCLPQYVSSTLSSALTLFNKKLCGFADPNAIMTGTETRSSSPIRIVRDKNMQSQISGIYPCGEGAGYAGGITSAAVDGIRIAEAIATTE